jgi:glutamyl-tRNA synthetase
MIDILSIGRGGKKPRKDFGRWSEVKEYVSFFFEELFQPDYSQMPANLSKETVNQILEDYAKVYDEADDSGSWFEKLKAMCPDYGFTADMKAYRKDPTAFAGNVGDLSMVLRVAVCGRSQAPDLHTVMQLLGKEMVLARLAQAK